MANLDGQAPKNPRKRGAKKKPKRGLGFWVEWTQEQGKTKVNAEILGIALFSFLKKALIGLVIVIITITLIVLALKGLLTWEEAKKIFGLIGVL